MVQPICMFSPADVNTLMNLVSENTSNGSNLSSYYISMVSGGGHYMIKFTGFASDIQTGFGTSEWKNKYRDYMRNRIDLEKGFQSF